MEIPVQDLNDELLQRIEEISSLCERIERALDALVQCQGDRSESIASLMALQVSVTALKRDLLQQYLENRIAEAARALGNQASAS